MRFLQPSIGFLAIAFLVIGCQDAAREKPKVAAAKRKPVAANTDPAASEDDEADIEASLAKLSAEDRKLAKEQRFCVIENDNRLGSMGPPVKIVVEDETVFVCCRGCTKDVQKNPADAIAKAKELRAQTAATAKQPKS